MKGHALLASLLVVGCASPMTALRDDNHRLNQSVSDLRTERRAQDRKLRDLQRQLDQLRAQAVAPMLDGSMPELRTEVAAPPVPSDGSRVIGVDETGAEIVYEGDAAAGKPAAPIDSPGSAGARSDAERRGVSIDSPGSAGARSDEPVARLATRPARSEPAIQQPVPQVADRIEVTRRARTARVPVRDRDLPTDRGGDAGADYRAAVELVKAGQHDPAVAALRAFVGKYPRHDYADNAQYWLGESFYAHKEYAQALVEFRAVIEVYPRGNKVPDALLKVGYCYQAMGQTDKARAVLEQVVSLYPKTEPAALAAKRLESK